MQTIKMQRKFFDGATQVEGAVLHSLMSANKASQTGNPGLWQKEWPGGGQRGGSGEAQRLDLKAHKYRG